MARVVPVSRGAPELRAVLAHAASGLPPPTTPQDFLLGYALLTPPFGEAVRLFHAPLGDLPPPPPFPFANQMLPPALFAKGPRRRGLLPLPPIS